MSYICFVAQKNQHIRKKVFNYLKENPGASSGKLYPILEEEIGYSTLKRLLGNWVAEGDVVSYGNGKGTRYSLRPGHDLLVSINLDEYFSKGPDERKVQVQFNFDLIKFQLAEIDLFTPSELELLNESQSRFLRNVQGLNRHDFQKEFERLAIDLSWKSAQIEGNTYSLLETELLLLQQKTASGKTKDEAVMLLNHKDALDFIFEHEHYIQPLRVSAIEDIHSMLTKELKVDRNIRNRRVGITGTNYRPLDNEFQIREAMKDMCDLVNSRNNVFEKALLVLLLISYIQPFNDGNKRTARIISNALLMHHHHCPISFRTIDPIEYKKAMLVFYEQSNISAFKKIFIEQFVFATNSYF
ncbi:hypothetical protein MASR2M44_20380 [Bacteroidota bacterium]